MYRRSPRGLEVFLVHPGGPFWAGRDAGAWTIPKGEFPSIAVPNESPLEAAQREFTEETGFVAQGPFEELGTITQGGGKRVTAWAFAGDCDPAALRSICCTIEYPPRSGRRMEIPEVDRGQWFSIEEARERMLAGQLPFLDALAAMRK
jgi:predicted NUDIX family NTP pyrophosphohydrolase